VIAITLARKPLTGTVARNVLTHGTGGLAIDACRISTKDSLGGGATKAETVCSTNHHAWDRPWKHDDQAREAHAERVRENVARAEHLGRWPSNLILMHLEGCYCSGTKRVPTESGTSAGRMAGKVSSVYGAYRGDSERAGERTGYGDADGLETVESWVCQPGCPVADLDQQNDSASRFFLQVQHEDAQLEMLRASGDCLCEACGRPYREHPVDGRATYLNVLCDGRRVKL
jgi:hypothetical protein